MITKAYGGRAVITFNEHRHTYTVTVPGIVEKLYQPSVTGIIGKLDKSGALVPWAVGQMADRIKALLRGSSTWATEDLVLVIDAAQETWRKSKQDAADIGSLVHRVLEQELLHRSGMGPSPVLPLVADLLLAPNLTAEMIELANNSVEAGFDFLRRHNIKIVQAEGVRWSATHGYIGTGDLIARMDGALSVLDWKTGKRLYPTVFLQLAAYQAAYEEEFPDQDIQQRVGINIGRDGELNYKIRDNGSFDEDFAAFLALLKVWRWDTENQGEKWSKPAPRILGPLRPIQAEEQKS